jgi:hypothetical protein
MKHDKRVSCAIRQKSPILPGEPTVCHPAVSEGSPFAYLQCYRNADYPEWGNVIEVNDGIGVVPAFSVDTFNK